MTRILNAARRRYHRMRNASAARSEARDLAAYQARVPLDLNDVDPDLLAAFKAKFDPSRTDAGAFATPDEIMLFVHIPKTAGMSLGLTLQKAYDVFRPVAWDRVVESFDEETRAAYADRSVGRQVVIGHYGWPRIAELKAAGLPVQAGSFLRDPAARLASNYDYNCSPAHPWHADFRAQYPTFDAYIEGFQPNFQCMKLGGEEATLPQVIETLVTDYTFLGLTEAFGASLRHLGRSHGLAGLTEFTQNRAPNDSPRTRITRAARERIYARHGDDLRLVRLLKDLYGL